MNPKKKQNAFEYFANPSFNTEKREIARIVALFLNKSTKALDIGGGGGEIWQILAGRRKRPHSVLLIDTSRQALEKADSWRIPWIKTRLLDAEKIDCLKQKFDLVLCSHLLPQLSKPKHKRFVRAMLGKLKENGVLLIVQPRIDNPLSHLKRKILSFITKGKVPSQNYLAKEDLEPFLKNHMVLEERSLESTLFIRSKDHFRFLALFLLADYKELTKEKLEQAVEILKSNALLDKNNSYRFKIRNYVLIIKKVK